MDDNIFKELVKDPVVYIIAVMLFIGANIINKQPPGNASWIIGVVLLVIATVSFLFKLIVGIVDQNFRKKYTELIAHQESNIAQQQKLIDSLAQNTRNAYDTMSSNGTKDITGGYKIPDKTSTSSTGEL